ncbi:hypothetical protein EGW08_017294 [Elysia chlorotica]|uniref:Uncharacterized protein n=1 Tax=Elysia chlorotica TaxID=188477 RepID=A0A433T065_ELYCH|nr:hypothetical protein EGW08_017294 [Elysia chlorotica]
MTARTNTPPATPRIMGSWANMPALLLLPCSRTSPVCSGSLGRTVELEVPAAASVAKKEVLLSRHLSAREEPIQALCGLPLESTVGDFEVLSILSISKIDASTSKYIPVFVSGLEVSAIDDTGVDGVVGNSVEDKSLAVITKVVVVEDLAVGVVVVVVVLGAVDAVVVVEVVVEVVVVGKVVVGDVVVVDVVVVVVVVW